MKDFKFAKIYKITSPNSNKIYIGSTCDDLNKRLTKHKGNYKTYLKGNYNYVTAFEILKNPNAQITLLENYPCKNEKELHEREKKWIEKYDCINKVIPTQTKEEYNEKIKSGQKPKNNIQNNIICDKCKTFILKSNMERHLKSKKHLDNC